MARGNDNSREAGLHKEFTKGCLAGQAGADVQVKCNPPFPNDRPLTESDAGVSRAERMRMLTDTDRKTVASGNAGTVEKIEAAKRVRKSALDDAVSTSGY